MGCSAQRAGLFACISSQVLGESSHSTAVRRMGITAPRALGDINDCKVLRRLRQRSGQ